MDPGAGRWRTRDLVADPLSVVDQIVHKVEQPGPWVEGVLRDLRFVIDRFVADDITVLAPPFLVRRQGDPVWVALRDLPDEKWESIEHYGEEHLAEVLDLDVDLVLRHPVAGAADVLWDVWTVRGHDLDAIDRNDSAAIERAQRVAAVVFAWFDLWDPERQEYVTSRIGLERTFQDWLVKDLRRLAPFGLPVELIKQEYRFADGRKADVVCRATADTDRLRRNDLLVIENKAHMVDVHAYEQLHGYVGSAERELARDGEQVHGLLIADGRTLRLQEQLENAGYYYVSLSQIGFRDWLRGEPQLLAGETQRDSVRDATVGTERPPAAMPAPSRDASGAPSSLQRHGRWLIGGIKYATRREANRALACQLGSYTPEQWQDAKREHGLA